MGGIAADQTLPAVKEVRGGDAGRAVAPVGLAKLDRDDARLLVHRVALCDTVRELSVAVQTISDFLSGHEMTVYIVLLDRSACQIDKELYSDVEEYIRGTLFGERICSYSTSIESFEHCCSINESRPSRPRPRAHCSTPSLEKMLSEMDDTFAVTLLKLIDLKGMTDVECYKKANVSKQTWYKILNEKNYKPSKNTVIAFAIALELTLEEANGLLATVGFTLSKSSIFDIIIEYFIIKQVYDIFIINETLFKFDQVCLGV
jgi:DNA-binding phage protein